MNKTEILDEYKKQEERLLMAKILDKIELTKTKNKIQYSDFLNLNEQESVMRLLKKIGFSNYYFFGGGENVERKMFVCYPEKLTEEMSRKNDKKALSIIRIKLPNELFGEYDHRTYLGSIIKIGVEREKDRRYFSRKNWSRYNSKRGDYKIYNAKFRIFNKI